MWAQTEELRRFLPSPRRREVVFGSSFLLRGLFSLLDVGDLQDGHQELESILDVGRTVGRLWREECLRQNVLFTHVAASINDEWSQQMTVIR